MSDVVQFLTRCLDAEESDARACAEMFPSPWDIADRGWRVRIYAADVPTEDMSSDDSDAMTVRNPVVMEVEPDRHIEDPRWLSERVAHIARQDPAATLKRVAAERAIVEYCSGYHTSSEDGWIVLRHLATARDDQPGFDEGWRVR